jgi:hypothetical protein
MSFATISFHVKSGNAEQLEKRDQICRRVIACFDEQPDAPIAPVTVICLIDDQDFPPFKTNGNEATRGFFAPLFGRGLQGLMPDYFWNTVAPFSEQLGTINYPYDCVIYLHGSTCMTEIGLTLTLAHELQHFVQYSTKRRLWAANTFRSS